MCMWVFRRSRRPRSHCVTSGRWRRRGAPPESCCRRGPAGVVATYCQNAGGYGARRPGQPPPPPFATVASGAVRADADGYVPFVTVTCVAPPSTCQGIILLGIFQRVLARTLRRHHTIGPVARICSSMPTQPRTIAVPLTPGALAYVRANSPVTVDAAVGPRVWAAHGPRNTSVSATWSSHEWA